MADMDDINMQIELLQQQAPIPAPQSHTREQDDLHFQLRKCCKNIFEDLKTLEDYEQTMKKEKQKKKKDNKDKEKADDAEEKEPEKEPGVPQVEEKVAAEVVEKVAPAVEKQEEEKEEEKNDKKENEDEEDDENAAVDCDLLFIMDCTGSMSSYINMCRTQLFLIVEQVKKQFENSVLKIGFVAFRDFGDAQQFETYPFTTEYDKLKNFINGLQATGGNDTAEDVAGAFAQALEMHWTCEAKYAILITDAYPHGNKYSKNNSGDRYPGGDPQGRVPENQIVQMIKKGICFYGLDVSSTSNQMYQVFNQAVLRQTGKNMERMKMSNAQNGNNANGVGGVGDLPAFAKAISTSVTNTITATITAKTLKSQKDVFDSKIMRIINNNRKFGTKFSQTNVSAKTDDSGLDDFRKYSKRRNFDGGDSSSSSDSYGRRGDSSDEEFYYDDEDDMFGYKMKPEIPIERKLKEDLPAQPSRGTGRNNYYKSAIEREEEYSNNLSWMQKQKRQNRIYMEGDMIHEDEEEEKEEKDDHEYVKKRKEKNSKASTRHSSSHTAWLSDQELIEALEVPMMPSIRFEPIQEDYSGKIGLELYEPFSFQKEEVPDRLAPVKEKKRAGDDDSRDRKVDPYIKKISEEENKKVFQSICYSFHIDDSKTIDWEEPQLVQNQIKTIFTVEKTKFSEGAMREAHLASDKDYNIELVAKLHKEADLNSKYNFLKKELTGLILANFFLTEFNQRILFTMKEQELPPQILRFVDCYIYEVIDEEQSKNSYFYSVENLMKGDFQKYNNNAGYVIDGDLRKESQLCQAFSHFTWQYSQGNCMVVDLQGTEDGQLTDPQIHTLKKTKKFGQGDLGYEGILRFFRTHTCTSFCEGLSLIHPKTQRDVSMDYQFEDFHALQKQQVQKQQKLKQEFDYEGEDNQDKKESEIQPANEAEKKVENGMVQPAVAPVQKPKPISTYVSTITPEERAERKYVTALDKDKDGVFGIDDFFELEIDEKLIASSSNPKSAKPKEKPALPAASVPAPVATVPVKPEEYAEEQNKDCTRLICSLCKKVGEYNTKELLSSNKKLNQLVCSHCEQLSRDSAKLIFDCSVCKCDFEVSSYVLKMKRLDKATRCEKCSLY